MLETLVSFKVISWQPIEMKKTPLIFLHHDRLIIFAEPYIAEITVEFMLNTWHLLGI